MDARVGHEAILYGRIIGASAQPGPGYRTLQDRNRAALRRLPREDDWPWLVQRMFSVPGSPGGTYRRQVIHFGASIKDDPSAQGLWDVWLAKFEALLRRFVASRSGPPRPPVGRRRRKRVNPEKRVT